ncbi:hypothetical protein N7466_002893 [Penicillium verhagenii]|uniref:uncharacterized protein n=1 Tax=Penicillium verhagenii TaxID=1562060 RepID=UPI0025458CA1|nr:uncharacterized protein N7466_002893 [Penicillium verhagenii]KAJ5939759.1 hypothetical protein N7466_002893 [Penicillium verhagenii]
MEPQRFSQMGFDNPAKDSEKSGNIIQLPSGPSETDLMRWDMLKITHSTGKSVPLTNSHLKCLLRVLQDDHPSYTEDEIHEKAEFAVLFEDRMGGPGGGDGSLFSFYDMRALELILKIPFMDRARVDAYELDICIDIFTATTPAGNQKMMSGISPSGLRLLSRVMRKTQAHHRDTELIASINRALETGKPMPRSTLVHSLEILKPFQDQSAIQPHTPEQVTQAQSQKRKRAASQSDTREHVTQANSQKRTQAAELSPSKLPHPSASTTSSSENLPAQIQKRSILASGPTPFMSRQISKDLRKALFDVYCQNEYPTFPLIDLPALKSYQADLELNEGGIEDSRIAVLLFCCAIACFRTDFDLAFKRAQSIYQSAMEWMPSIGDSGDLLRLVQCQALKSQYLWASGDLLAAWEAICLAIRMAYKLGIELKSDVNFDAESHKIQVATRLWHSMQTMERSLTLDIGTIYCGLGSVFNVRLASKDWTHGIPGVAEDDDETAIRLHQVFVEYFKLHTFMDNLRELEGDLRLSNSQCALEKIKGMDTRDLMDIEEELISWDTSLPIFLKYDSLPTGTDVLIGSLRTRLRLRFLYFKLRLYRPLLIIGAALCGGCASDECVQREQVPHMNYQNGYGKNGPSRLGIVRDAAIKCLQIAVSLAELLRESKESTSSKLSPCEYLHYLYACALVLIAGRELPFTEKEEVLNQHTLAFGSIRSLIEDSEKDIRSLPENVSLLFRKCSEVVTKLDQHVCPPKMPRSIDELGFEKSAWQKLYARLNQEPPPPKATGNGPRPPFLLGWYESLPTDMVL